MLLLYTTDVGYVRKVPQRRLPRLVAALLAVVFAAPAVTLPVGILGADAHAASRSDLDRNNDRLREARGELREAEGRKKATLSDLQQIEARRAQVVGELAALNAELAATQARLNAAEAKLAEINAAFDKASAELERTRADLARQRALFEGRVRETFKRGTAAYAVFTMDVRDINEFARAMKYIDHVMRADRERMVYIAALEKQVKARADELQALQERQRLLAQAAAADRDAVASLVNNQRSLMAQAEAEAQRHRTALADIESDRAQSAALVASLERESAALEAELRRRAEEERRQRGTASRGDRPSSSTLTRPYNGPKTSSYGWREHPVHGDTRFHAGNDYAGPTGDPFWSAGDGVVVSAGWRGGYGNAIVIDHGNGLATLYAHASALHVRAGQDVRRGQVIGDIGSTGYSTGPHLHFEVRQDGEPRNPDDYV